MSAKKSDERPSIDRLIELQKFLNNFHAIERVIHLSKDSERRENDTEHSYTLAMLTWYLAQYFPELDTNTCIRMALVHDLVEIYAGDTFTFGDKAMLASKAERELRALEKIEKEWPDFKELTKDIREYEALNTPESCFVYALDKLVPVIVIYLGGGKTWHDYSITLEDLRNNKKDKIAKSPQSVYYFESLFEILEKVPHYFPAK